MLNKKVCQACVASRSGKPAPGLHTLVAWETLFHQPNEKMPAWMEWTEHDERDWEQQRVRCRFNEVDVDNRPPKYDVTDFKDFATVNTNGPPPKFCPYATEHIVSQKPC